MGASSPVQAGCPDSGPRDEAISRVETTPSATSVGPGYTDGHHKGGVDHGQATIGASAVAKLWMAVVTKECLVLQTNKSEDSHILCWACAARSWW